MDDGRELIQGVDQDLLETSLPRLGGAVLVLYGKHKGVFGNLVEKDMEKETGVILDADNHALLNVHLKQIAEYIRDPSYVGFELVGESKQFLTTYTFGTHTAKHTFCKVCGITSFYMPRSNPDGVAVSFRCVDPGTLTHVEIKHFDGRNWESSYDQTSIASASKLD
ncbi:hypothetical protein HHK36_024469 [Tetracentron sinense]|uniref:CENP-V/GFA domain-containing protein n=1 Tax=Tetracentron sinense TaxID=13715 RepID=A0A834YJG2_TETSI|nr:hypothetical protein HHK36_024469 [Tetracentron sinense]